MLEKLPACLGLVLLAAAFSTGAMAQGKVIKIGSQVPLTGSLARVGGATFDGIKVAIEQANAKYGDRYHFELLSIDDETSPAKAVAAVEKLVADGAVAIVGGYGTNMVGPASGTAHELGVPYVTAGALGKALTGRGYQDYFQVVTMGSYSKAIAGYLEAVDQSEPIKVVSIVHLENESNSELADATQKLLEAAGKKTYIHGFTPGSGNYTAMINRIRTQERPDALVMAVHENEYIGILRAARLTKMNAKAIVGGFSIATARMNSEFNDLVQNVAGPAMLPYPAQFSNAKAQAFAADFEKVIGHSPDYLGILGNAATELVVDAIVRAADTNQLDSTHIARNIANNDSDTLLGKVKFDNHGANSHFVQDIGQHQGERVEIVWPQSAATADIKLPGRSW